MRFRGKTGLTPRLEDYLKQLWLIEGEKKVVRVKDLQRIFGVRTSSVIDSLKALEGKGLIVHEKYGYIELTEEGIREAENIYSRYLTIYGFFKEVLGLENEEASTQSCRVEHYLSNETIKRMKKIIGFFRAERLEGRFQEFLKRDS